MKDKKQVKTPRVKRVSKKTIVFLATPDMEAAAKKAAAILKKQGITVEFQVVEYTTFANGELKSRVLKNVRAKDVFLFFDFNGDPNIAFMRLILTLNALHLSSVHSTTPIVPYLPYLRQDRKDEPRVPISAAVIIRMIEAQGSVTRLVTIDMHTEQLQAVFENPIDHLPGFTVFASWLKKEFKDKLADLVFVGPDFGSAKRVRKLAEKVLGPEDASSRVVLMEKERGAHGSRVLTLIGADVAGRICVINDDMIDTGGSIVHAAEALYARGAATVIVSATHAIFSPKDGTTAYEKLAAGNVRVVVTDSLKTDEYPWLTVIELAPYLAHTIKCLVTKDGSVSEMINGGIDD